MKNILFALSLGCSLGIFSFVEAKPPSARASVEKKGQPGSKAGTTQLLKAKANQKVKEEGLSAEHPFMQALMQAYTTNPELKAKVKEQNAIAEELPKAYAGWRPKINGTATAGYGKISDQVSRDNLGRSNGQTVASTHPKTAGVEVRQNIFEGGKSLANTTAAENQILSGSADFTSTEQSVLLRAIRAYLDLWSRRQELEITRTSVRFFEFNVEQTKARADVGEVGLTEVAEAEFRYAEALADFVTAEAEVQNATAEYVSVIGHQPPKELVLPSDISDRVTLPLALEDLKHVAIKENPSLQKAIFDAKIADAGIDVATADLMPKVDVVGDSSRNLSTRYRGSRTNDVSAKVEVRVPIYQGGADWAVVRASHQTASQKAIEVRKARNQVIEIAIKAWETRHASKGRVKKLEAQIKAGETRIEGTRQESLVGERTLLDVLNAQKDVVSARISLVRATRDFLSSGYEVLAVMGHLSTALLKLPVQKYDVKGYAEEASGRYIGWGDVPSREEIRDVAGSSR
jgi:outer membrane protein